MLKVKLFNADEQAAGAWKDGEKIIPYDMDVVIREMLRPGPDGEPQPPFRDEESRRLLEVFDIEYVEDDWYSVVDYDEFRTHKEREPVWEIGRYVLFGLCLIQYSRRGQYLGIRSCSKEVWQVLERMPFDILVAVNPEDRETEYLEEVDYQIVNYPLNGSEVEVTVKSGISFHRDDFYTPLNNRKNWKEHSTADNLYVGKDGKYYMECLWVPHDLHYFWKDDAEGIAEYIESRLPRKPGLTRISQYYRTADFGRLAGEKDWIYNRFSNEFTDKLEHLEFVFTEENGVNWEAYRKELDRMRKLEAYKEYQYWENKFMIVNHMVNIPEKVSFRKLPFLILDRNYDGTYYIHGSLTVKYPTYTEILADVIGMRGADHESLVLVVDVEERLNSRKDIDSTVCGFLVRENAVELFDADEALERFAAGIRAAFASGRCTVSREFY